MAVLTDIASTNAINLVERAWTENPRQGSLRIHRTGMYEKLQVFNIPGAKDFLQK